ncbi:MAG: phosphoenolpyruvate hydrolase family protein [Planctomycetes bacterium]|nr:phosphoenolpyruvate hydrolase family protein [Planctomycetota bacterium]
MLKKRLDQPAGAREPLIAVVAGSGLIARTAAANGADVLMVLNAGLYRHLGAGSLASFLPYGDPNAQTLSLLREQVLPRASGCPVVAGVWAGDAELDWDRHFETLRELGVSGVTNWPAVGFTDGSLRAQFEADGWSLERERSMLERAGAKGLIRFAFVFDREQARACADLGAEALVLNLGLTRAADDLRERRDRLQHALRQLNDLTAGARAAGRTPWTLVFGGPVTAPEDLEPFFRHGGIDGFAGGSVFERLPVEAIVASTVRRFKGAAARPGRGEAHGLGELLGKSAPMLELFARLKRVAPHDVNVLIEGESGTGKELVATQLHALSPRRSQAFVTLNCGAIPDTLLESEFFGHEKGAFTGADRRRMGKFELAHRGTLFLDEIADLSMHGQVALLRVLQQREIVRVGGDEAIPVDVRVVAASNRNLADLVRTGAFREDLYFRLNPITLSAPPLRERLADLPLLVDAQLARLKAQLGKELLGLSAGFYDQLSSHGWPGNVRELQQVLTQAALLEDGPVLEGRQFTPVRGTYATNTTPPTPPWQGGRSSTAQGTAYGTPPTPPWQGGRGSTAQGTAQGVAQPAASAVTRLDGSPLEPWVMDHVKANVSQEEWIQLDPIARWNLLRGDATDAQRWEAVEVAMVLTNRNKTLAAEMLKISRRTLYAWLREIGVADAMMARRERRRLRRRRRKSGNV